MNSNECTHLADQMNSKKVGRLRADVVEAKYIALVDYDGNERASMALTGEKSGGVSIRLLGEDGTARIALDVIDDQASIQVEQPGGIPGVFSSRNNPTVSALPIHKAVPFINVGSTTTNTKQARAHKRASVYTTLDRKRVGK